jgi:hypothetical protein
MMCTLKFFLLLFSIIFCSSSVAQTPTPSTTVVTLFLRPYPTYSASILAVDSTATTYVLQCPSPSPLHECGDPFTQIEGPSTVTIHDTGIRVTPNAYETIDIGCKLTGTTAASCSLTLVEDGTTTVNSHSDAESAVPGYYGPVTVTAGLEKLPSNTPATATTAPAASTTEATMTKLFPTSSLGSDISPAPTTGTSGTPAPPPSSTPNAAGVNNCKTNSCL